MVKNFLQKSNRIAHINIVPRLYFKRLALFTASLAIWGGAMLFLDGPFKMIIAGGFLLLFPGLLVLSILSKGIDKFGWKQLGYSVGLSLIFEMMVGLLLNQLFIINHWSEPLTTGPLTITLLLTVASLIGVASRYSIRIPRPKLQLTTKWQLWLAGIWGGLLPVTAAGGAIMLNNSDANWLAMSALGLIGCYLLFMVWSTLVTRRMFPYALYMSALALLLSISLRGWNITGHDIMQEFQVFELTKQSGVWLMSHYQDAYSACLSITILPTIFQQLTGIADQYIYKLVFQLFFALIAPLLYLSLSNHVSRTSAFLATVVFITFPTFLSDMSMLNRQETAILCLMLAIIAALDQTLGPRIRQVLALIFLLGMVISHYSTSYVAAAMISLPWILGLAVRLVGSRWRRLRIIRQQPSIFSWWVVAITVVCLVAWNGPLTHTAGNFSRTAQGISKAITSSDKSQGPSAAEQNLRAENPVAWFATTQQQRTLPAGDYYGKSLINAHPVQAGSEEIIQPNIGPKASSEQIRTLLTSAYDIIKQLYAKLIQVLIVIGLAVFTFRRKRWSTFPVRYTILAVAALGAIAFQVLLPSDVVNYGLLRLIQQNLLLLSLPVIIACLWLLKLVRIPKAAHHKLIALLFVGCFWFLSGFLPTLTGGYKPVLNLSNAGLYYREYYTHQDEIAADQWLATNTPAGSRIYADEFARRQLITYGGRFAQPTLIPNVIPVDSYVYLSNGNMDTGNVPVYIGGDIGYYKVPFAFLSDAKNLVYSSGDVRIYR